MFSSKLVFLLHVFLFCFLDLDICAHMVAISKGKEGGLDGYFLWSKVVFKVDYDDYDLNYKFHWRCCFSRKCVCNYCFFLNSICVHLWIIIIILDSTSCFNL